MISSDRQVGIHNGYNLFPDPYFLLPPLVQYGEEAIKEGMGSGGPSGGMADIFDMFTGGGGRGGGRQRERRSEDVQHKLACTLEDLYNGTTK